MDNRHRLMLAAFWVALAFAFVMATLPHPPPVLGNMWDKGQHMLAFGVLTTLALLAYPTKPPLSIAASLSAFGFMIEVVQAIPSLHRDSDYRDWIADTVAIAFVLVIRAGLLRIRAERAAR